MTRGRAALPLVLFICFLLILLFIYFILILRAAVAAVAGWLIQDAGLPSLGVSCDEKLKGCNMTRGSCNIMDIFNCNKNVGLMQFAW